MILTFLSAWLGVIFVGGDVIQVLGTMLFLLNGVEVSINQDAELQFLLVFHSLFDLLDQEYFVLVELLVHGELASLSEGSGAAFIGTLERLLACMDISMLLQILSKSKFLVANQANELLLGLMGSQVPSQ